MPGDSRPPFAPGNQAQRANHGGRPRKTPETRAAEEKAKESALDMVEVLIEVALDRNAKPGERALAADKVLDRALGKPVQAITGPDGAPLLEGSADIARLELARLLAQLADRREVQVEAHVVEAPALPARGEK